MKNLIYLLIIGVLFCTTSCQQADIHTWNGTDGITFNTRSYNNRATGKDTLQTFSFYFEPAEKLRDTAWVYVTAIGNVYDYPRTVSIKQAESPDGLNAVPGVHYVPFDDPEAMKNYVVPAGKSGVRLPIILLRDEVLKTTEVQLRIELYGNEFFAEPPSEYRPHRTINISDFLSEPSRWSSISHMMGNYGRVKHDFMNKSLGEPVNDEWIKAATDRNDYDYLDYLQKFFTEKLEEENKRRASLDPPLGPLHENNEYKTPVIFKKGF